MWVNGQNFNSKQMYLTLVSALFVNFHVLTLAWGGQQILLVIRLNHACEWTKLWIEFGMLTLIGRLFCSQKKVVGIIKFKVLPQFLILKKH